MTTYQPPYSFIYWRLLLVRKWPPISLHIHSSTDSCCCTENDHLSTYIFILLLEAVVAQNMTTNQPPYSFFYWKVLLVRKWPPISLHDLFIYWKVLLVRKRPPISLHIHSSTDSCCCTENDHQSASIFILLLKAVVGQKMTTYQPPYSFFYWRLLLHRKWPPFSLHIHSSTEGCCCTENDHLSASIFILLLEAVVGQKMTTISASIFIHLLKAVVGQKMTTCQPPYSFIYWRLLLVRKRPPVSLHIHSSTEGCCWSENDHLSASIFIPLLIAVVAQKMTTYQPPYSFLYW